MPASQRFQFRFADRYERAARPFGVRPSRAWVEVTDTELVARYGPWQLQTPLSNIARVRLTGPYRFAKTAGPARLGVTDLGLTFASNGEVGVEITFHRRVRGVEPTGLLRHGELTVTVEEPERLLELIERRIGKATEPNAG